MLYKFNTLFPLFVRNFICSTFNKKNISKSLINTNTKTIVNVIKKNPVDIITHLNFCSYADAKEVAKVASDYGTYIELNSKKTHLSEEELYQVASTGVKFIISSDAHTPDRVGEVSLVEKMLEVIKINEDQIANINGKLPTMRFKAFKERA